MDESKLSWHSIVCQPAQSRLGTGKKGFRVRRPVVCPTSNEAVPTHAQLGGQTETEYVAQDHHRTDNTSYLIQNHNDDLLYIKFRNRW